MSAASDANQRLRQVRVTAVVVTFNRLPLLQECLRAIADQSRRPDRVIVVDNASSDGTASWLREWATDNDSTNVALMLDRNRGGAGGFSKGLECAVDGGADWVWMMDDDACPTSTALAEVLDVAGDPANIYGSLAVCGDETSWIMTMLGDPDRSTTNKADIPSTARVQMLPFLGFLVHRELVKKIGLPDAAFFIAADDVEYCVRARKSGAEIFVAGRSHIEHPKSRPYSVKVFGRTLTALELPPWKRYYDTRNRLLIARRHYGIRTLTHTVPGSFIRLFAAIAREPRKPMQMLAFVAGMIDGALGITGKRHDAWGIK
jgi:GT2 family glycosyltransferase